MIVGYIGSLGPD
ncbi:hypothetical protein LINPERHAP2_LOCUS14796 [Linum perenne]